jgi:aspartyl-tRNA(Asn)/glutamyl-tRNA(Gln) amidotransferase subunit A
MSDLLRRPLTEITRDLARRALSPVELMQATLDRIDAVDAKLNAFVALRDRGALIEAARSAEARIQRGEGRPLEGVPLGVKDLEDAEGLVTTHGCKLFADNVAARDSVQVERLRAAGAIVVGKTNAPEFGATAITKNLLFGESRNPWNPERTPGGSSGGSSAAIAGALIPLVTASDGGGSIRIPATFTGCFGHKPSYGRIPKGPDDLWPMDDTAVVGPLTRTVEDAALHLDLTVGAHPLDPNSLPHPGVSYRELLPRLPAGLRIGFSPDLGYAVVQSDVADVVGHAVPTFETLGHHVELLRGGPPEPGRDWGLMGVFQLLGELDEYIPSREDEIGRGLLANIKLGTQMTPQRFAQYRKRREELNRWCAELFERFDLLVTPTVPYDPPAAKGPLRAEVDGKPQPDANVGSFTMPFNQSWHPAATVRCGFSKAGLPVGLQIVGPRHRDDLVLQAAWAFEQAQPWAHHWPSL